jgi:hypothetical protein
MTQQLAGQRENCTPREDRCTLVAVDRQSLGCSDEARVEQGATLGECGGEERFNSVQRYALPADSLATIDNLHVAKRGGGHCTNELVLIALGGAAQSADGRCTSDGAE